MGIEVPKLNRIDEMVKAMMLTYPSLFPSRIECWHSMFTNSGYEWDLETGELVYIHEMKIPDKPKLEEINTDDDAYVVFEKTRKNMLIQLTWDNIDIVVTDYLKTTTERQLPNFWDVYWNEEGKKGLIGKMQQACIHKDKIHPDWRYEISRFCDWIISKCRQFVYCPSMSKDDKLPTDEEVFEILKTAQFRKVREMAGAFKCAVKVKENIFTDEEKSKHQRIEEEIVEMAEKAVENTKKELNQR